MKHNTELEFYAILLAAGKGSRLETKTSVKKQFITYQGTPLWWQSIKKFYASPHIKGVVLVFPHDDNEFSVACEEATNLHTKNNLGIPFFYAKGGEKRHESVFSGLEALPPSCTHVLIHDSARPFFSAHLIHKLVSPFQSFPNNTLHAIIPAIAVTDTIKRIKHTNLFQDAHKTQNAHQAKDITIGNCTTVNTTNTLNTVDNVDNVDNVDTSIDTNTIDTHNNTMDNASAADAINHAHTINPHISTKSASKNNNCITDKSSLTDKSTLYEEVEQTLERQSLRAIQTPQAFSVNELREAHKEMQIRVNNINQKCQVSEIMPEITQDTEQAIISKATHKITSTIAPEITSTIAPEITSTIAPEITDDAMLMEHAGHTVYVVQGEVNNIKITQPEDLELLHSPTQQIPCSGYGYDVHRFGGNRPFILGGISIPTHLQIEAHSDGDVLLHALMDALLSCMCLGDIGTHFPDSNPKYQNISSSLLLDHVMDLWKKSSLTLCHVDLTIITQKPHINPFAKEITKNIARLLSISPTSVNTKATTEEKLGFTGKELGIKAVALVTALKNTESIH